MRGVFFEIADSPVAIGAQHDDFQSDMNEMMQGTVVDRYRLILKRFDYLWDQSTPDAEAEASSLLQEIQQLEFALLQNDSAGTCATPMT